MKTLIICIAAILASNFAVAQDVEKALSELKALEDHRGNSMDLSKLGDEIYIIFVPLTDPPIRVYDMMKGFKFKDNVALVGGFSRPGSHSEGIPAGHLRDGLGQRYDATYASIWLDTNIKVAEALGMKGHSIAKLSVKKKKALQLKDYENKVDDFIKALEPLKK